MRWPKAHAMNELILGLVAAWEIEEESVIAAYKRKNQDEPSPAKIEQLHDRVNRSGTLYAMAILASRALLDPSDRATYALRGLAMAMDRAEDRAVQNTLRDVILPTLSDLGWINGFEKREVGQRKPHAIEISDDGIEMYTQLLRKCFGETRELLEEVLDQDSD